MLPGAATSCAGQRVMVPAQAWGTEREGWPGDLATPGAKGGVRRADGAPGSFQRCWGCVSRGAGGCREGKQGTMTSHQLGPHGTGNGRVTDGRHCLLGDSVKQSPESAEPPNPQPLPMATLRAWPATGPRGRTPGANLAVLRAAVPTGLCAQQTGLSLGTRTQDLLSDTAALQEQDRGDSDKVTCRTTANSRACSAVRFSAQTSWEGSSQDGQACASCT